MDRDNWYCLGWILVILTIVVFSCMECMQMKQHRHEKEILQMQIEKKEEKP